MRANDVGGYTPLHYAASNGHRETVRWLVENGANKDAKNKYGRKRPREVACEWYSGSDRKARRAEIIALLQ